MFQALVAVKRENTPFNLVTFKSLSKLLEAALHDRKGVKLGVQKVNDGRYICNRAASVGNEKHCVGVAFLNRLCRLITRVATAQ